MIMDADSKTGTVTVKQEGVEDAESIFTEQSDDMFDKFLIVKVEKRTDGYENDENGNFERNGIDKEEDDFVKRNGIDKEEDDFVERNGIDKEEDDFVEGNGIDKEEDDFVERNGIDKEEDDFVEGNGIDKEEDEFVDVVTVQDTHVTEISDREKRELELVICDDENTMIGNGESEGLNNCHSEESDSSSYTCALCKQTLLGSDASKIHLEGHISANSFHCLDCEVQYTAECLQSEHTLIVLEIVGHTLEGRLYRYIGHCQLLVRVNSANCSLQIDEFSKGERTHLNSSRDSLSVSTSADASVESKGNPMTDINAQSEAHREKPVPESAGGITKSNCHHFEAASLKKKKTFSVERPYICMICYRRFNTDRDLGEHLLLHNQVQSYVCPNCNLPFVKENQLRTHLKQNETTGCELHVCTFCNKLYKRQDLIRSHMYKHTGRGAYECQLCKKKWKNKSILKRHLASHGSVKQFPCYVCNKLFSTANSLKVHMNIHTGERSFACTLCNKVYSEQRFLRVHMCSHTGEGNYACKICSKSFYSASQLKLHTYKHTGERPHVCSICNEAFLVKNSLLRHMYRHDGLKPHACITCGKTFVLKQDLSEHVKTHAFRSHICKMCNRGFTTGAYLNRHMKQQCAGAKGQFECNTCKLKFTKRFSLARHRAKQHGKGSNPLARLIVQTDAGSSGS